LESQNDTSEVLEEDADPRPVANSFHLIEKEEHRDSFYQRNDDKNPFMRFIDATDIVIFKLEEEARERLGEMNSKLKRLMRREWLVDRVLRNGFLWVGGLASHIPSSMLMSQCKF
jgi:hypothetical protein